MAWILACFLLMQGEEGKKTVTPPATEDQSLLESIHGSVSARYRLRATSDDDDHDLYEYLEVRIGESAYRLAASIRFSEDLDGNRNGNGFKEFDSVDDTYDSSSTARVYSLYLDIHEPVPGLDLRLGRQTLDEIPEAVIMDGGAVRYTSGETSVGLFGGLPANLFESSTSDDAMFGGWVSFVPWHRGTVRLEYMHLKDETAFGLFEDDLFGLSLDQKIDALAIHARYTFLEGESRDLVARLTAAAPEEGFVLQLRIDYLFKRQQARAQAIDPYSIFLIDLEPYVQVSALASQDIGRSLILDGSITVRELVEDDDETSFNREFMRVNVTARTIDWPFRRVSIAVPIDYWNSSQDDFWTLGGDVSWTAEDNLRFGLGTAYALYEFDRFTGEERERVRSVYLSARWKVDEFTRFDIRYSFESNDVDDYTILTVGARRAF